MCWGERSSSANGAIALRQSAARSWSTSSSRVLSDWTIRGPSFTGQAYGAAPRAGSRAGDGPLACPERRDVGTRGAAVRAVAPRPVGGGVDEDVLAPRRRADAEPVRPQVAHERGQAQQG